MNLKTPLKGDDLMNLKPGDPVLLSGKIHTARDAAHKVLLEQEKDLDLNVIYHCGPLFNKENEIVAAGPTTSARMEKYTAELVAKYGVKAVIGKGGMDPKSLNGAVYFAVVGGAAVLLAKCIKSWKKIVDLGATEAVYELFVEDLPCTVGVDALGNSIYDSTLSSSKEKLQDLLG